MENNTQDFTNHNDKTDRNPNSPSETPGLKRKSRFRRRLLRGFLLFLCLGIGTYLVVLFLASRPTFLFDLLYLLHKKSTPSKCVEPDFEPGVLAPPTGCFNGAPIRQAKIKPPILCLKVKGNTCQGQLRIQNNCHKELKIANLTLPYVGGTDQYVELVKSPSGEISAIKGAGYTYAPEEDELLKATGQIGERKFTISYIKTGTKNQCD